MTNNNNWNTVNWDEIPDDVDAVVTFKFDEPSYYKEVDGELQVQCYRRDSFECSRRREIDDVIEYFGDRFHLRPSPTSQPTVEPTPEPTESTQVESSEVEATTTPEFDWSSVDDDVEAVIVYKGGVRQCYKVDGGVLLRRNRGGGWEKSHYYQTLDEREKCMCDYWCKEAKFLRRPPAEVDKPPVFNIAEAFEQVAKYKQSTSIHTILQEAQQSILKHHGVTGKVIFTVECSE